MNLFTGQASPDGFSHPFSSFLMILNGLFTTSVEALSSYKPTADELEKNLRIRQKYEEEAKKRKEAAKKKRNDRRNSRNSAQVPDEVEEDPEVQDIAEDYIEDLIEDLVQNDPGAEDLFGDLGFLNLEEEEIAIPRSRRQRKPRLAPVLRDQYDF